MWGFGEGGKVGFSVDQATYCANPFSPLGQWSRSRRPNLIFSVHLGPRVLILDGRYHIGASKVGGVFTLFELLNFRRKAV